MNAPTRKREYASDGASREVRVIEFFQRFPSLIAYLRDELEKATAAAATDGAFGVHPSLYPILALFSRLRPSPAEDRTEYTEEKSGTECIAPIVRCLYGNYLAVRAAAARCLVALVPSSRALEHADAILAFTSLDADRRATPGANAAHGAMLFLSELLAAVRSGTYGEDVCLSEIAAAAAERLGARAAYGVDARVPLISAAWLRCAETTLAIANIASSRCARGARCACAARDPDAFRELANMTWQCSAPVLAARASGPGSSEWRKAAAGARTRLALGYDAWGEPFEDSVRALVDVGDVVVALSDAFAANADYEYRAETYKAMFKTPRRGDANAFGNVRTLRRRVVDALGTETRHTCARRALRCLELFSRGDAEDEDGEDEDDARVWTVAHDATFSSRNERVRAEGLRAIATLCRRRLTKNARATIESGDANAFVLALRDGAAADKSDETRLAAADALRRSEILAHVSSSTCANERSIELALTAWTCALTLIEDADADVRAVASRAASVAVASRRASSSSSGAHAEETLCDVFAHARAEFGASDAFRRFVVDLARGPSRDDPAFAVDESSNARRLFDREADNPYAEELLLAQLAAKHVVETFDARDDILRALETTLDALDVAMRRAENHEHNRFVAVARASIGAWCFHDVLSRSGDDGMTKRYRDAMDAVRRATPCLRTGETKEDRLFLLGHRA